MPRIKGYIRQHTLYEFASDLGQKYQDEGLHVFAATEETKKPVHDYPFRSDHFSVFLITSGSVRIRTNLIDYTLRKNNLFLMTPDAVTQFVEISPDATGMGMGFTADFMLRSGIGKGHAEKFDFFAAQSNPCLLLGQEDAAMLLHQLNLLLAKHAARQTHPFGQEVVNHSFCTLMYEVAALFQRYNKGKAFRLSRKEQLLMRFLKLLPDHFKTQRSVQYYAEQLFVTPKYLTESVKEITNKTAGEFIDEMVMTEAKLLLSDPSISVARVADTLYFSDQFFFSKYFKKQAGISPSAYRKAIFK